MEVEGDEAEEEEKLEHIETVQSSIAVAKKVLSPHPAARLAHQGDQGARTSSISDKDVSMREPGHQQSSDLVREEQAGQQVEDGKEGEDEIEKEWESMERGLTEVDLPDVIDGSSILAKDRDSMSATKAASGRIEAVSNTASGTFESTNAEAGPSTLHNPKPTPKSSSRPYASTQHPQEASTSQAGSASPIQSRSTPSSDFQIISSRKRSQKNNLPKVVIPFIPLISIRQYYPLNHDNTPPTSVSRRHLLTLREPSVSSSVESGSEESYPVQKRSRKIKTRTKANKEESSSDLGGVGSVSSEDVSEGESEDSLIHRRRSLRGNRKSQNGVGGAHVSGPRHCCFYMMSRTLG